MVDAGLLVVASQGRHRYYRLASPQVALMLESMMVVAAEPAHRLGRIGPADEKLRLARTCYDHLAGRLAVGIADSLVEAGHLSLSDDGGELTESGQRFFERLGFDLSARKGRPFCRPCLDWSERRHHIAGTLGTQIKDHCLAAGWIKRDPANSRPLRSRRWASESFVRCSGCNSDQRVSIGGVLIRSVSTRGVLDFSRLCAYNRR